MKTWWQKNLNRVLTELRVAETVEGTDTGDNQKGIPRRKLTPDSARGTARVQRG